MQTPPLNRKGNQETISKAYDVLVIGSGTGQAAAALNNSGLNVGMVEHSDHPGGTCALSGCQAKKWFYEGAEIVARSRHLEGIGITSPAIASWPQLREAKNRFTERVPGTTVEGLKKAGIEFIQGRARFVDQQTIAVDAQQISARFIVLATGATPMPLPIDGIDLAIDSSAFIELDDLPSRIVFIGGGFISFEFAHFAVRLGPNDTRCNILEAGPRPLGPFDEEMVDLLTKASAAENIASRHHGGRSEASMDYRVVPAVLFTYPQYAMVGKTEHALKDQAVTYEKSFAKELDLCEVPNALPTSASICPFDTARRTIHYLFMPTIMLRFSSYCQIKSKVS